MSRRKTTVVSPKPATSILRRSMRLQNLESQKKPRIDLVSRSEPLKKARREIIRELSKRLVYSLDTTMDDSSSKKSLGSNGFPMLRRSLRLSSRELSDAKKKKHSSMKSASTSSFKKKPSSTKPASTSSSKKHSSTKPPATPSSKKPSSTKPASTPSSKKCSSTKPASISSCEKPSSTKPSSTSSCKKPSSTKPASTSSSSKNPSSTCTLRRSPRFLSGGGESVNFSSSCNGRKSGISVLSRCSTKSVSCKNGKNGDGVKSRDRSRSRLRPRTNKQMFRGCYDDREDEEEEEEEVSGCLSKKKRMRIATPNEEENAVSKANEGKITEEAVTGCLSEKKRMRIAKPNEEENGVSKANEEKSIEEEASGCLSKKKRMSIAKLNEEENGVSKANKGKMIEKEEDEVEGLKTKQKLEKGWTEELELALQGAYLTVKPSPNFWKKVAKMVPGKSAQECFDRVNSSLITPRQAPPRRSRKTNLSPIPQFSISASKLLKPNSPKSKIRQRRKHLSKKMVRHLLEKQNHMDQGLGFDLFSVLEPDTTSNILSTPMEKGQSLPKILESPMPCTRTANKEQTTLVSPPVLKQVKNMALHEKYIDHLHIREAKRKAESTRLIGKENIRPIDIQKKDMVKAAKDSLFFNVQDAMQKLKGLEAENTPSSSEFCNDLGETDEEDEQI